MRCMIIIHWEYISYDPIVNLTGNTDEEEAPMFMPAMFGLYFALIGVIAWDNYCNTH